MRGLSISATREDGLRRRRQTRTWSAAPVVTVDVTKETPARGVDRHWYDARRRANEALAAAPKENEREGDTMKSRWIVASAFAFSCLALIGPGTVSAHHAFSAEFDANKPITLRGTVAKVEWINPHSWIHVDV